VTGSLQLYQSGPIDGSGIFQRFLKGPGSIKEEIRKKIRGQAQLKLTGSGGFN
jgi:hypothetical protein